MNTTISISTVALFHSQILASQIGYYGPLVIIVIGTISCICNLMTFTAPQLRSNSCAFYFLISALFEFCTITFGLLSAHAFELFDSTLWNTNEIFCKIRSFLAHATPLTATFLVLLSSIDRYTSSSIHVHLRAFSQIKMAYRATVVAIVMAVILCAPSAVGYVVRPICRKTPGAYEILHNIFAMFSLGVIPHLLMLVFGSLTCLNIRRSKKQIRRQIKTISVAENQRQRTGRKKDTQLIAMMLVQVGLTSTLNFTYLITCVYYSFKPARVNYSQLASSLVESIINLIFYANYAKSFYIYTLSSDYFRSIFVQRIKLLIRMIPGRHASAALKQGTHDVGTTAKSRTQCTDQLK